MRFEISFWFDEYPLGPVQEYVYVPVPPVTDKSIEPSLAPLHDIPKPLKFDIDPLATNSSGSVISISSVISHPLASVTTTAYTPGSKLFKSSELDVKFPPILIHEYE